MFSPLKAWRWAVACGLLLLGLQVSAQDLQLRIDDIEGPSFSLRGITVQIKLAATSQLNIRIAHAQFQEREWRNLSLQCPQARIERTLITCRQGVLAGSEEIPFNFNYWPGSKKLELILQPSAEERWQVMLQWQGGHLASSWAIKNGQTARLNPWLPASALQFSQGVFDLNGKFERDSSSRLEATLSLRDVAFSDAAGNRAGEKLSALIQLQAQRGNDTAWQWQMETEWRAGEVFWQPFYLPSGQRHLTAQGRLTEQQVQIQSAQLRWDNIGQVQLSGAWERQAKRIEALQISGKNLALAGLYSLFVKPVMPAGLLRKVALQGTGSGQVSFKDGRFDGFNLSVKQGVIQDETQRFSLAGLEGELAWQRQQRLENRLRITSGKLGKLPLGAFELAAKVGAEQISIAPVQVPILDGLLSVESIEAQLVVDGWQWSLSADLQPISMQRLSQELKLPTMHGTLSAIIPQVRYEHQVLQVGGALLFKVFDGTVVVTDLSASDLFGLTPHIYANIDMRNLDLTLLTRTFSFGSIQGRLDVTVRELELFGWKPVRFDAKVASSLGEYPRKISQRAVENITSLGGTSGTAAIQRSFLRFFDQFGYRRIGLTCRLSRGVCSMGGVEDAPNGYVIVEGGGIPALTVIGYNRTVDWDELLARLQRATQGGKPIVQ